MIASIDDDVLERICRSVQRGAKLYIGHATSGKRKIKVVRGPLGLLTKRYECLESDVDRLRQMMAKIRKSV